MNQLHLALTFSLWALEALRLPPMTLIGAIAMITVVWAAWRQRLSESPFRKPHHWSFLTHLLFFPAAIAVGVLLPAFTPNDRPPFSPNRPGKIALDILTCASFASCGFWIWKMKGSRWLAGGLMMLLELLVLGAFFIAGMSVTGDWL